MKIDIISGMERRKYKVVLKNGEDGWIVARVPALPGCISQGKGRKDALTAHWQMTLTR